VLAHEGLERRSLEWPGEVEALPHAAAQLSQGGDVPHLLDALGDDRQLEALGELEDRTHERFAASLGSEALDERAVDLERVYRKVLQQRERRVPRPEVVESDAQALCGQLLEDARQLVPPPGEDGLRELQRQMFGPRPELARADSTSSIRPGRRTCRVDTLTLTERFAAPTSCRCHSAV